MKKILKSPLFWVVIIEVIIAVALYLLGFKITYAPNLSNDWEAISAVASWVSAIATIFIPLVVVLFQNKLDQNKNEISDANKAALSEFQKFADKYSDLFEAITSGDTIVLDGGRVVMDFNEDNVVDYIRATIKVTVQDVASYFDVTPQRAMKLLENLVEQNRIIQTRTGKTRVFSIRK